MMKNKNKELETETCDEGRPRLMHRLQLSILRRQLRRKYRIDPQVLTELEDKLRSLKAADRSARIYGLQCTPWTLRKLLDLHYRLCRESAIQIYRRYRYKTLLVQHDIRNRAEWSAYMQGDHDAAVAAALEHYLGPSGVGLDIGANVGLMSLPLAKSRPGAQIHSFEPNPEAVSALRYATVANGINNVQIHSFAIGDVDSEAELRIPRTNAGAASLVPTKDAGVFPTKRVLVPVRSFMGWWRDVGQPNVDVVKIDVEGFEPEVVAGMWPMLQDIRPVLIIEMTPDLFDCRALISALTTLEYKAFSLREDTPPIPVSSPPVEQTNFLFIPSTTA